MLRLTVSCRNTYLTASKTTSPISMIRSSTWSDPDRMVRHKLLYFTLGLDQQALRRTAVIVADKKRLEKAEPLRSQNNVVTDPTGFKRARKFQLTTWHKRIQYQEYHLEHLFVRHVWGLLRMYPPGGAKIPGKADRGYFGYDKMSFHRYTREQLPANAQHLYERRK